MLNYKKMIRILPITFIFMYAIGVFGMLSGVSMRNDELIEMSKLFSTYSLIPAFITTIIFSLISVENKNAKLIIYVILFIISAFCLYMYIQNNGYENLEMMQNFVLFPILFISVLGIVWYEIKYLKE